MTGHIAYVTPRQEFIKGLFLPLPFYLVVLYLLHRFSRKVFYFTLKDIR